MTKTTWIVLIAVIVVIVLALLFMMPGGASAPGTATTTASSTVPAGTTATPSGSTTKVLTSASGGPSIATSKLLLVQGATVSLYDGVDPSGRTVYTPIPGVDGKTFKALSTLVNVENPSEKDGGQITAIGKGSVAYYEDATNVYVLSVFETSAETHAALERVNAANRASFAVTGSPWYAKDKTNVYALEAPANTNPYTPGSYTWKPYDLMTITNANPASFVLVTDSSKNYDAHDNAHTYRKGTVVGTYPQ
jgi:hypothetical protein